MTEKKIESAPLPPTKKLKRSITTIMLEKRSESMLKAAASSRLTSPCEGRSLFLFSSENRFRRLVHAIANHKFFEYFGLLVITVSSIFLAFENPLNDPDGNLA